MGKQEIIRAIHSLIHHHRTIVIDEREIIPQNKPVILAIETNLNDLSKEQLIQMIITTYDLIDEITTNE